MKKSTSKAVPVLPVPVPLTPSELVPVVGGGEEPAPTPLPAPELKPERIQ